MACSDFGVLLLGNVKVTCGEALRTEEVRRVLDSEMDDALGFSQDKTLGENGTPDFRSNEGAIEMKTYMDVCDSLVARRICW
jgi:hypothetical protein